MEKVRISTNEMAVDAQIDALNDLKKVCENLIEPFNVLGLGLTTELLRDVATGGYKEIEKIVLNQVKNDLKTIKTPSIRQSMENEAKQALSVFKENCEKNLKGERRNLANYLEVEKGHIKVAPGSLEVIQEQNTYYLTDAKEIEAYRLHNEAVDAVNRFLSIIERKPQIIAQIFKYHTDVCLVEVANFDYGYLLNSKN